MRLNATRLGSIASSRSFGDQLDDLAGQVPSLDLNFAQNKSLIDDYSGTTLVTHTRASSGTYVGSDGVLRSAVTNLLLSSEEFDSASWAKTRSSITSNTIVAPDGTLTGDKLVEDTTAANTHITRPSPDPSYVTGTTYTYSVFAQAAERTFLQLRVTAGASFSAWFNLSTGVASPTSAGTTPSVTDAGNGWYRCAVTFTATATATGAARIGPMLNETTQSYTGDGTSGIYLWGAQLEQSSTVGEYVPTTSTINSAPRFDHNPATGESLGLLVEEQRTNLLLRSEEFDNASWNSAAGARTITPNSVAAPDGLLTADTFAADGTTNAHFVSQSLTLSAVPYAYSVFAKAGTNNFLQLRTFNAFGGMWANFDLATGVVGTVGFVSGAAPTSSIQAYPNGWYRCTMLFTPTATTSSVAAYIVNSASAGGSLANSLSTTLYLWGAQLEAGSFSTSYIPTVAATVTRAADVASITGSNFSSWYRQDEGTVFANARTQQSATSHILAGVSTGSFASSAYLVKGSNNLLAAAPDAAPSSLNITLQSVSSNVGLRAALAFTAGTGSASATMNGGTVGTDASTGIPITMSQMGIGTAPWSIGTTLWNGHIARLTYWPTRLGNEVLQRITQ